MSSHLLQQASVLHAPRVGQRDRQGGRRRKALAASKGPSCLPESHESTEEAFHNFLGSSFHSRSTVSRSLDFSEKQQVFCLTGSSPDGPLEEQSLSLKCPGEGQLSGLRDWQGSFQKGQGQALFTESSQNNLE